jgi:hypothetical protein
MWGSSFQTDPPSVDYVTHAVLSDLDVTISTRRAAGVVSPSSPDMINTRSPHEGRSAGDHIGRRQAGWRRRISRASR